MNVDRVARAMTEWRGPSAHGWRGPSASARSASADSPEPWRRRLGPAFTARVMAPIYGRPQPDFTKRVIERLEVAQPFRARALSAARPFVTRASVLVFVPAVIALAVGAVIVRASRVVLPAAPAAPRIAAAAHGPVNILAMPAAPPAVQVPRGESAVRRTTDQVALPEPPAIYMIAALEPPPSIAIRSIEPASVVIPPLAGPAAISVADMENQKEKS